MTRTLITALTIVASTSQLACAADGSTGIGSGLLGTLFLGLIALVVAVQLIPGLVLLGSMFKGMSSDKAAEEN